MFPGASATRAIGAAEPRFRSLISNPLAAGALFAASLVGGAWALTALLVDAAHEIRPALGAGLEDLFRKLRSQHRRIPGFFPEDPIEAFRRNVWINPFWEDDVYEVVPIRSTIGFASWLWTFFDTKVIDGTVNGLALMWGWIGDRLRPIQTGRVQNYTMYVFGGMVVLVAVLAWVWGA